MDAAQIVRSAFEAGVHLYLDKGQLAFKAKPGQFSAALRELVRDNRESIVTYLAARSRPGVIEALHRDRYPLSHTQRRLHFLTQLEEGSAHYNLRVGLTLDGALDEKALLAALNALVERHAILRTTYGVEDGSAEQRVNPATPLALEHVDLTGLVGDAQDEALQALMAQEARRHFDLTSDGVMAVRLVKLGANRHAVLLTIHHLATDGTSMTILTREFMALYDALRQGRPDPLPALPFQYGDFAAWQQGALGEAVLAEQLGYWREALAGVPVVHRLPLDKPRPAQPDYVGHVHRQRLEGELLAGLNALAQRHGCTLFLVVKALFAVLLGKYAGSHDVVIGVPAAGRNQPGTASLVGFFANTLVFRHVLAGETDFATLLEAHKAQAAAVFRHQDVPFELLVETLQVERHLSHHPLIQVFLAFQNYEQESLVLDGLRVEPLSSRTHNIRFDLELTVQTRGDALELQWGYATALFERATIERLASSFLALAQAVIADSRRPLSALDVLPEVDRRQLAAWNATGRHYDDLPLPAQIAAQARRTPAAIALDDGERRLDYRTLLARADGVAQVLRARGVGPGSLVGVYLPRTVDMVVGLLGIHRAGAAYVPLDPGYPAARLAYIVEDSALQWVVTDGQLRAGLSALSATVEAVLLETVAEVPDAPDLAIDDADLAYVIYTSGSTGRPKGVMVEHRQLGNFRAAMQECLGLERGVWLAVTAYSFDISILELLCPLAQGFTVVIGDHQRHAEPGHSFAALMTRYAVTHLQCTPSLLRMYMELPAFCEALAGLDMLMVGGEACPAPLVERLERHTRARLINLYGPTETAIWSSCAQLGGGRAVTIGRPIANTQFYVVDEALQPVPVGVQGELLIGGAGVSRGYLGRDALTAERFVYLASGERVYRTGDLVRWLGSGELLYVGRCDAQVKIRGHRVELGEIEAQLCTLAGVREAAVTLHEPASGEAFLAAYLVADTEPADEAEWLHECKRQLARELTGFMMPSAFLVLDRLPMTPNGKIDRNALPAPEVTAAEAFVAPRTPTEAALLPIWQQVLDRTEISVRQNFFAVGGHSLIATRLVLAINAAFGCQLRLADIFLHQTIAEQASLLDDAASGAAGSPSDAIVPLNRDRYPLSHTQRRLHFLTQLEEGSAHYNLRVALKLDGALDQHALLAALNALVERHAILRTTYVAEGEGVEQRVNPPRPLTLGVVDLSFLAASPQEAALQALMAQEARRHFDLASEGVVAARLALLGANRHAVLLTIHHLATDGTSMTILTREFMALYDALRQGRPDPLPALPFQYGDFAAWQQGALGEAVLAEQLGYWREALAGVPVVHRLPLDKPRPAQPDYVGHVHRQRLEGELLAGLNALAQRHGCTLFLVVKALFAVLLGKYAGSHDVVIGVPAAGRNQPGTASLVGFFANTLVFRHVLAGETDFATLLEAHKAQAAAVFRHQDVPFELLVETLQVERHLSHHPLIQVFLAFQNYEQESLVLDGLRVEPLSSRTHNIRFDLELTVQTRGDALELQWGYATALFERATIERLASSFLALAQAVIADSRRPLSALDVLPEVDRRQLAAWNATGRHYDDLPLPAQIAAQARRTPAAIALDDGERRLDYRTLLARADGVAQVLRARGVGPGSLVGVYLPRTVDMVVGLLGIHRAGAAYVPLDPGYPAARLAYIVEDSALQWVVTDGQLRAGLSALSATVEAVLLETVAEVPDAPDLAIDDADLAYVIYTSGSTGRPKGVMVEHRQLGNFRAAMQECLGLERGVWLAVTAYSFDISILELLCPLAQGFTVVIGDHQRHAEPGHSFAALMTRYAVTHLQCTPSLLRMYMELPAFCEALAGLDMLMVGGEACPAPLVERLERHTRARLINLYGPTETAIWSSCAQLGGGRAVTIGRPIANTQFYVVDEALQPVPVGVQGELLIGGAGVSRGYLGRDALTAERFVYLASGERVYRTGDLVRWLGSGELLYVGRCDAQVKIRGHRVELGEIEAQLCTLAGVREAAVTLHEPASGEAFLAAYLVADTEPADEAEWLHECKRQLARELTGFMMPSAFLVLDRLPMTPNGKIDRNALPAPESQHFYRQTHVAPETPLEVRLEALWRSLLGREQVSATVGFFEAGGHSLLATRLVSGIRAEFEVELSLREIFEHRTIREQAALIGAKPMSAAPRIRATGRPEKLPLSFAQQRIWFVTGDGRSDAGYNIVTGLSLAGRLDRAALLHAVRDLFARHEVLRTTYHADADGLWQRIHPDAAVALPEMDWSSQDVAQQRAALERLMASEGARAFDLSLDRMLRATLVALSDEEHALILVMHHIASDGWSMDVLVEEFGALYAAYSQGQPASLPALPVQYADYALWQQAQVQTLAEGLDYWSQQLAAAPELTTLPGDRPRPAQMVPAGANYRSELPAALVERIRVFCQARDVTPFMLLEAVLALLVSRYSDQRDVVIGTPVAGRLQREVEPLVGCFVNNLALRTQLTPSMRFDELLATTRSTVVDAYGHQGVPFDKVVERLQVERSLSHSPLFQILFTLQNTAQRRLALPELTVTALPYAAQTTKYDLELTAWEHEGALRLSWQYATALFDAATIEQLSAHYATLLSAALSAPASPVYQLPMQTAQDQSRWQAWNQTSKDYPRDRCVHELFDAQVQRTPQALAVTDGERNLCYADLDAWASRAAQALRAQGVGPGSVVGLHVGRSLEQVVGVLAILKAGGAYLPLEPEHPDARLSYMCQDSRVRCIVSVHALASRCASWSESTLCLDDAAALAAYPVQAPVVDGLDPQQLAYVIYTSGSTGQPKGVLVPHQGVVNYLDHAQGYLQPYHRGAVMGTPLSFDATVTTLFTPLLMGKCLVVLPSETGALFAGLGRYLFEDGQEWLFKLTPAHLDGLYASDAAQAGPIALRHCLVIGGEQLSTATVVKWQRDRLPQAEYVNEYGPTETVVGCSVYTVRRPEDLQRCGHAVAIGRPIQNTQLYVLNELDEGVPPGAVGELCIGGDGVTRGYQNRDSLTASRFREHRLADGTVTRLYHSGDIVRWAQDGELEYLGRRDEQVKLRGYRIELGEIEAQLKHDARVSDAAAVVQGVGSDRRLVAFVASNVSDAERGALVESLQQALRQTLAEYMRPTVIEVLASLPLTANGKVDRSALPHLSAATAAQYRAPETETERTLAVLWQELLERSEPVGAEDNFFRLGGHSLLATRMVVQINSRFAVDLSVKDAFERQDLAALAELVDIRRASAPPSISAIRARAGLTPAPLSFAQQRLWFIDRLSGGSRQYNIALPIAIHGRLDVHALTEALKTIVERHEVLRTVYREDETGSVQQHVQALDELALSGYLDLREHDPAGRQVLLAEQVRAAADTGFDLSLDRMLRATLVALSDEEHALILVMHHIASDGWSMDVLVEEFGALYAAYSQGQPASLPALPVQYADYALWQQAQVQTLAEGLDYWSQQLAAAPELTTLPGDRPRPAQMVPAGANYRSELPAALVERIRVFCQARDVTPFMLLEAVLALLVSRYSDQRDVVIGTPVAGRLQREVEPLVGCFVNNLALRTQLTPSMRFDELLATTRSTVVDAYGHQGVPFDKVVERLQVERSLSHSPLFQILFTLQNTAQRRLALPELTVTALPYAAQTTKYDLELTAWEHEGALRLSWQYATALFDAATIEQLSAHYATLLSAALSAPASPVYQLPMQTAQDQSRWQAWNQTSKDYPRDRCVHELFDAQVQRTPQALAVTDGERNLCYADLDAWASRAAQALRAQGVGPGSVVGLHVGRSLEQVVGVLAILKAGGAYLPLEPEHPDARLSYMCQDSRVRCIVSVHALASRCASWSESTLCLDDAAALAAYPVQAPVVDGLDPQQLAYVIYTSGSTGQPKGVLVPHQGVVNYLDHAQGYLQPYHRGAVMGTPLSFDATVTTLFTPLLMGKCLVVLPSETGALFAGLGRYLFEDGQEWLFKLTPAHLDGLYASDAAQAGPIALRHCLVIGGEQLSTATVVKWQRDRLPQAEYVNEYGPTETVVGCSVYTVRRPEDLQRCGHAVAIGRPIQNTQLYVLNELDEGVPPGAVGELCIGGDGVTRGYQNRDSLTASRFREHRLADGTVTRLYHSGDIVRWAQDGELEYLGRRDEQVKLRGYRIELGEIEAQLKHDARVSDAAAVVQGVGSDRRLVAFVASNVSDAERGALVESLQQALRQTLAEYMRPTVIEVLASLPLTANGKVDRSALPHLSAATAAQYRAPETETERTLAVLWQELLERSEPVGAEDNFFRLGGHSLLATRMVLAINQRCAGAVQLKDIFELQTLAELALHIDVKRMSTSATASDGTNGNAVYEELEW
ncbi:non-ribosomal peptide synthetase [Tahibacter amnicola]|uniref:Amino acid adenylation domain-containing protein n=1 Tax=Tahibacter amnicola TaxID=2976241 RepID=A0ABY6B9L2_9GAMM|nr:non-ribosomal peptide synthetase [Tahibacter amnicola]UXI66226.1 amino acid adenylation domain-containing protein [Tahibacter amnicola]